MNINGFTIHPQLTADCHLLGKLGSSFLLLHRNAAIPWLILVPQTNCEDLLDLPDQEREQLMSNARDIANFIKAQFDLKKINVAALGNVVPQLHLHVIGRHPDDPCWPNPVWGNLGVEEVWPTADVERFSAHLCD